MESLESMVIFGIFGLIAMAIMLWMCSSGLVSDLLGLVAVVVMTVIVSTVKATVKLVFILIGAVLTLLTRVGRPAYGTLPNISPKFRRSNRQFNQYHDDCQVVDPIPLYAGQQVLHHQHHRISAVPFYPQQQHLVAQRQQVTPQQQRPQLEQQHPQPIQHRPAYAPQLQQAFAAQQAQAYAAQAKQAQAQQAQAQQAQAYAAQAKQQAQAQQAQAYAVAAARAVGQEAEK